MGTAYTIRVSRLPAAVSERQVRSVIDTVLARIDISMSGYRADSEISRFNASSSTGWFEVSADLAKVVAAAVQISSESQGALDVTVAPLVELWGFGPAGSRTDVPAQQEVQGIRAHVGFEKLAVRVAPPALRKADPQLEVDLNAVAPGYAVDLLAAELMQLGVADFMIEIGGEVRVQGRNARGKPWRIAVEKPVDAEPEPLLVIELTDAAVTTSGEYRHYDFRAGRSYSHTIDPRSGAPVQHELSAVVVVSSSALLADAWATALNVLGERAGYALAERRDLPVLFVTWRNGAWIQRATPAFEPYLSVR